jgi:hypothetical protein
MTYKCKSKNGYFTRSRKFARSQKFAISLHGVSAEQARRFMATIFGFVIVLVFQQYKEIDNYQAISV